MERSIQGNQFLSIVILLRLNHLYLLHFVLIQKTTKKKNMQFRLFLSFQKIKTTVQSPYNQLVGLCHIGYSKISMFYKVTFFQINDMWKNTLLAKTYHKGLRSGRKPLCSSLMLTKMFSPQNLPLTAYWRCSQKKDICYV